MKKNLFLVGFFQALGVVLYCALISSCFWAMSKTTIKLPEFFGGALMLVIFVFSAALTSLLVFGYPACLFLKKEVKKALYILAYTLLCLLGLAGLALVVLYAILKV